MPHRRLPLYHRGVTDSRIARAVRPSSAEREDQGIHPDEPMTKPRSGSKAHRLSNTLTPTLALALVLGLTAQARPQGFAPDVAASRMMPAEGLAVNLYAAEPDVRQPILVKFDDRGRLWTIQYLQYPNPAGLKRSQGGPLVAHRLRPRPRTAAEGAQRATTGSPSARTPTATAGPTASRTS